MRSTSVSGPERIRAALAAFEDAAAELTASTADPGVVEGLTRGQVVALTRRVEAVRRGLLQLDAQVVTAYCRVVTTPVGEYDAAGDGRAGPTEDPAARRRAVDPVAALRDTLRIEHAEARARIARAAAVQQRRSLTGEPLAAPRPVLADAVSAGRVGAAQADTILKALTHIERDLDPAVRPDGRPDAVAWAEEQLVAQVGVLPPAHLRTLGAALYSALCPDGAALADDRAQQERRDLVLTRRRDGMWHLAGRLTAETGERLHTVLSPLAAPRPGSESGGGQAVRDSRSAGMRLHDALDDVAARLLESGTLPATGGTPTTLVLHADLHTYLAGTASATTPTGGRLDPDVTRRLTDQARILLAVVDDHGVPLRLGRTRRLADTALTQALAIRDGGCVFPTCERPPDWCQRHHVTEWQNGGPTDLDNLVLLCGHHHRTFTRDGWTVRIGDHGLPEWLPPPWTDPHQRPVLHHRHRARLALRGTRTPSTRTPVLA